MRRRGFGFGKQFGHPEIAPALQHAHELMELGRYAEAALAFEQLADGAEKRQGPRAPFLFIRAGHARMLLNQNDACMANFRHGLDLLATTGAQLEYYRAGNRISRELGAHRFEKEALAIADLMRSNTNTASPRNIEPAPGPARGMLPTNCPACGGPLRSDKIEWIDPHSAECPFCGSSVRAQ